MAVLVWVAFIGQMIPGTVVRRHHHNLVIGVVINRVMSPGRSLLANLMGGQPGPRNQTGSGKFDESAGAG